MSGFMDEFIDLMPTPVVLERVASKSISGMPTYGAGVTYSCRVQMRSVSVRRVDGTILTGRGIVYFPSTVALTELDRVTIASLTPGVTNAPILSVGGNNDELGAAYTSVVFG